MNESMLSTKGKLFAGEGAFKLIMRHLMIMCDCKLETGCLCDEINYHKVKIIKHTALQKNALVTFDKDLMVIMKQLEEELK